MLVDVNDAVSSEVGPVPDRLDSLTTARFLAALCVFLYHASLVFPAEGVFGRALGLLGSNGSVGVDFFFALSGFVLAWSWRPGRSIGTFFRRRFARLAPAYWVALLYGLVWVAVLYRDPVGAGVRALPSLVGLQAWFPDPAVHFAANGVEWSVSAEMFFYALFPALILAIRAPAGRAVVAVLAIVLACIVPFSLGLTGGADDWVTNVFPVLRIGEFMAGLLLAVAMRNGRRSPVPTPVAIALVLFSYFMLPLAPSWVPQRAVLLLAILLVIAALVDADRRRRTARGTAFRTLVRLGEWSYCFYLVHQVTTQIALFICAKLVPGTLLGPVWLAVALAASLLLAAALYSCVERPFERKIRGTSATAVTARLGATSGERGRAGLSEAPR